MEKNTPIINILTYQLPFDLSNQIYNEYQNRIKEAIYFIEKYDYYKILQNDIEIVELLLSLSIFHKRVISNLDAAIKFYGTVTSKSKADTIKIGNYNLNGDERNKLLAVVMSYNKLIQKFAISPSVMEYYETKDFLRNLVDLKKNINNAKNKEQGNNKDDIPF